MAFELTPGKLGFKLGEVLVGLQDGTTDVPETIASTQNKMHVLGYLWNPDTLAYVVPQQPLTDDELRAAAIQTTDGVVLSGNNTSTPLAGATTGTPSYVTGSINTREDQ